MKANQNTKTLVDPMPQDLGAERALLGCLLVDPDAILKVRNTQLKPGDFYGPAHGYVYEAALCLADELKPVDTITLSESLQAKHNGDTHSLLEHIGGTAALLGLIEDTPSSIYAEHYADIIIRKSRQRRMIALAGEIAGRAYHHDGTVDELYDQTSKLFLKAVDIANPQTHLYGGDEALEGYIAHQIDRAEMLEANPDAPIRTGWKRLDSILGDMQPATLHVVVARSSIGKTMYMENIAEYNAKKGHRVAYYHLELSHQFMEDRMFARHSGVSVKRLQAGYSGPELSKALDAMRTWFKNIILVHCAGWSVERIVTDIQRLVAKDECDLAIVDYLQKIRLPDRSGVNGAMMLGLMAEGLKTCAEIMGLPVVLGTQVSRDYKNREDQRPHMEDIRNSGEIEEKANQIVVLHRPGGRDEEKNGRVPFGTPVLIEAHVEKNTQGEIGMASLKHIAGRYLLVDDADDDYVEDIYR